jgi:tetrahydromethanopterin S-methyltransferase subunit C
MGNLTYMIVSAECRLTGCVALGICVAALKSKHDSAWPNHVIQAPQIAPSIWPLVLSAIFGNDVKALANGKVERGVPLLVKNDSPLIAYGTLTLDRHLSSCGDRRRYVDSSM